MGKDDFFFKKKMIDDMEFIIEHMKNQTQESLEENPVLLDSMMFRLIQISESSRNLSDEFKENHPEIPWLAINGLRNRIVHDYGNVKLGIVYKTLKEDIVDVNAFISKL